MEAIEGEKEKREKLFNWLYKNYILAVVLLLTASALALWGANALTGENRQKEIALWKALGATSKDALTFALCESLMDQLIAIIISIPFALHTLWTLNKLTGGEFRPDVSVIMLSLAGTGIIVMFLNLLFPWLSIKKTGVEEALRK